MTAPAQPIETPTVRVAAWRPAFVRSLPLRLSVLIICFLIIVGAMWVLTRRGKEAL